MLSIFVVVFVLNSIPGNKLAWYLNTLVDHRCQRFDHMAFFEREYAGGLRGFENDWRRWLLAETPVAVHF